MVCVAIHNRQIRVWVRHTQTQTHTQTHELAHECLYVEACREKKTQYKGVEALKSKAE
jgi:hypothetical protein